MYLNASQYVKFIVDNKLTQAQYLFLYLLRTHEYEAIKMYKSGFPTEDDSMIGQGAKKDLIDRGFIEHVGEGSAATDYQITEKFNCLFLKNHYLAADEIWMAYPPFVLISGKNMPLTTMDRYQFANLYAERIKYSVDEHNEVLKDVKYGRDKELISTKIQTFVESEQWLRIRQIRNGEQKIYKTNLTDSF